MIICSSSVTMLLHPHPGGAAHLWYVLSSMFKNSQKRVTFFELGSDLSKSENFRDMGAFQNLPNTHVNIGFYLSGPPPPEPPHQQSRVYNRSHLSVCLSAISQPNRLTHMLHYSRASWCHRQSIWSQEGPLMLRRFHLKVMRNAFNSMYKNYLFYCCYKCSWFFIAVHGFSLSFQVVV